MLSKKIKNKIIDIASDVMSFKPRRNAKKAMVQADYDVAILKQARSYDDAPDFDDMGMPTDAFKTRTMADAVRVRLAKKNKKK